MKLEGKNKEQDDRQVIPVAQCPIMSNAGFKLTNFITGKQFADTLHKSYFSKKIECTENLCVGAMMAGQSKHRLPGAPRPKDEVHTQAKEFLEVYFQGQKRSKNEDFEYRLEEARNEIDETGTWQPTRDELAYGAKLAWRNAARCIGRIQWKNLELQDARSAICSKDMFDALVKHLEYATNGGNIRSMITIFPPRIEGREDFRVWSPQMLSYAGYQQEDGTVIGDPSKVQLTRICQRLGWKGKGGRFDILPWVFSAPGETPTFYDIPDELVLRIKLEHPSFPWFAELNLEWYAIPAVSDMMFDVGGIEFTAAPFSGWYMGTEVGARDLCDPQRYNITNEVALKMGLDTTSPASLWKDKVLVEVNLAVLYSYQQAKVTIVDHHTAAETFMKHMETEQKLRGGCPADWVWVVPPMSASITPVYHQEMIVYNLKPSYEYQVKAWVTYKWKKSSTTLKYKTGSIFKAMFFATSLMRLVRHKRVKCVILYATETGKSETYAQRLGKLLHNAFNARVVCMSDYEVEDLQNENLIIIVASTFGSGEAPDNGKAFWKDLSKAQKNKTMLLQNIRHSVFALGSTQYPTFCGFGKDVDNALASLGSDRLLPVGLGDELRGQEQTFNQWAEQLYKVACTSYSISIDLDSSFATFEKQESWDPKNFRVIRERGTEPHNVYNELSRLHRKKVYPCKVLSRARLQARHSDRQTILVRMDTRGVKDLEYEPGDHLGVFPANPIEQVMSILDHLRRFGYEDDVVKVEILKAGSWKTITNLPPCTLETALTRYLDISSPPTSNLLNLLSDMATQNWDKYRLRRLSKDIDEFELWRSFKFPNFAEVLEEFPSIKLTPAFILTQLPLQQPRYYSISSSRKVCPNEVHLTMSIVNYHTQEGKGPLHQGVCTSYFYGFPQEDVPCFVKHATSFRLPTDKNVPIIMVGSGSGIAPFRSFWQQREYELKTMGTMEEPAEVVESSGDEDEDDESGAFQEPFGKTVLFFGCRQSNVDNIYSHETTPLLRKGVLQKVVTAYSRQPGQKKVYVQDALLQESGLVYELLVKKRGHVYVCGDAVMSDGVKSAIKMIIELESSQAQKEVDTIMQSLWDESRYHEDVFGVLHRRENTEMSWQQPHISYAKPQENMKAVNVKTRRKSSTEMSRRTSLRSSKVWVYRP